MFTVHLNSTLKALTERLAITCIMNKGCKNVKGTGRTTRKDTGRTTEQHKGSQVLVERKGSQEPS